MLWQILRIQYILLARGTMLYLALQNSLSETETLYLLTIISPLPPPLSPWTTPFTLSLSELDYFRCCYYFDLLQSGAMGGLELQQTVLPFPGL